LPEGYSTYSQPSSKVRKEKVGCQPIIMEEELGSTESDSESDEEEKETKSRPDRKANKIVERLTPRVVMKWNAYKFADARKRYNQVQHHVLRYMNSNIILSNSFPA